ncbi:MAG: sodium:proton antiporter [Oscillospiraceae bacterium]|nr:sodium:proton antiporter [Oscillospiraceae bacterium]
MELIQQYSALFYGILSVLALMLVLCLVRAVIGPRIADRLIAVNMMGTMVMVIIALLAVVKDQGYLVDICLIYAMISFLAVVVLTRIYTGVYREAKEHKKAERGNRNAGS